MAGFGENNFGQDSAELMLAAQNVVGPLDGNFAETFVAEALGVGIVLDALEYFGEGEGRYLRDLCRRCKRNSIKGNENVEVEVLSGGGIPGALVTAPTCSLPVRDNKGAGRNVACRGAGLH